MNEESKNVFGRIEEEMNEEIHPLFRKLRDNLREIGIVLGAIILVAAFITGYKYYQQHTIKSTQQEFEKILTSTQGKDRIQKLEDLLSTAPSALKQSILMEICKRSMNQKMYSKASGYWTQLAETTTDSNIEVIAKLGRANSLRLQDKNQEAMQVLQDLSGNAPQAFQKSINFELAVVAEKEKDWQKALSAYQSLLSDSGFEGKRQQYIQYKISKLKQKLNSKKS